MSTAKDVANLAHNQVLLLQAEPLRKRYGEHPGCLVRVREEAL